MNQTLDIFPLIQRKTDPSKLLRWEGLVGVGDDLRDGERRQGVPEHKADGDLGENRDEGQGYK